jgi:hypothetical protein
VDQGNVPDSVTNKNATTPLPGIQLGILAQPNLSFPNCHTSPQRNFNFELNSVHIPQSKRRFNGVFHGYAGKLPQLLKV